MSNMNGNGLGDNSPLIQMEQALKQTEVGGKRQKVSDFRQASALIEQYLAAKVPQRVVLDAFNNAYGYTLHPPGFRKMLNEERKRRAEAGDVVVCITCGQQLHTCEKTAEEVHDQEGQ